MKIITITLNPAFDRHCYAENFQPYHENLAHPTALDVGGKGVNVSRALTANGVESTAVVVLGRENGDAFLRTLAEEGIEVRAIEVDGRIRENLTIHTDGAPETRISFAGFTADSTLIERVERELDCLAGAGDLVTLTGRNPDGVSMEAIQAMLARLKKRGVRFVIDSRSFSKEDLLAAKPWLIKPNEEEIAAYTDAPVFDLASAKQASNQLRDEGIENVMISLGGRGAVLACADGCYVAHAPKVQVLSTIGAGDSAIAGFCAAILEEKPYAEALRYAIAYGSAACLTEGTRPPQKEDVAVLLEQIQIERI